MKVQVRAEKLSQWQVRREMEYESALDLLQMGGFPHAEYVQTVVSDGHQEPGYISLTGQIRR